MRRTIIPLVVLTLTVSTGRDASAIPPWARKYNMNCSGCHYPTVPRLNATGLAFKWAGYRMPNEIGEAMEVKKIEEYLGARGILQYAYTKTQGQPADENALSAPAVSLFAAGGLGKYYGAFFELEREPEGTVDLVAQGTAVWGKEDGFGGVRVATGHILVGGAIAGFDRPSGILVPLPLAEPTTSAIPFQFAGDQAGVEGFYVLGGKNRTSVQVLNGIVAGGEEMEGKASTKKDFVVTDQLMWDDRGSGITAVGYFGKVAGLDATVPEETSHYYRLAASANKFAGPFEVLGGYVYSKDSKLPTSGANPFPGSTATGSGYWFSGQFTKPKTFWTLFGRYEFLDPDRDISDDALRRVVLGSFLPVNVPEYLRVGLEYFRDMPQLSDSPRRNGITAQVFIAF